MQLNNSQKVLRSYWKKLVNDWEVQSGYKAQNIGGVDVRAVYNSSNYISRYISNETDTIIGNMWGMSSEMRKEIEPIIETVEIPVKDFNHIARRVDVKRLFRTNVQGKREKIREATGKTISVKNWDGSYVICTDDVEIIRKELKRLKNNRERVKIYNFDTVALLGSNDIPERFTPIE